MPKSVHSLASARFILEQRGLKLLVGEYSSNKVAMKCRCLVCSRITFKRLNDIARTKFGCNKCARANRFKISIEVVREKLRVNGFELISTNFARLSDEVKARCLLCGRVRKRSAGFLVRKPCGWCRRDKTVVARTYTTETIQEKILHHGAELLSQYKQSQAKIRVRFQACGHEQNTTWNNLQSGCGCRTCARNAKLDISDYNEVASKNRGKLIAAGKNSSVESKWQCSVGHTFERSLSSIMHGGGFCTLCSGSHSEMLCRTAVERLFSKRFSRKRLQGMRSSKGVPLELDIYSEELQMAVEHHGAQHYSAQENWGGPNAFRKQQARDEIRRKFCEDAGILLIEVRELGTKTSLEEMRTQIGDALIAANRLIPRGFYTLSLDALQPLSGSERYWEEVKVAAKRLGLEIVESTFLGADQPIEVRCTHGHLTSKTPRSIVKGHGCAECKIRLMKRPVRLSDGRVFESGAKAAASLGVSKETVNRAVRSGRRVCGLNVCVDIARARGEK